MQPLPPAADGADAEDRLSVRVVALHDREAGALRDGLDEGVGVDMFALDDML
jgi:hypothetical protein